MIKIKSLTVDIAPKEKERFFYDELIEAKKIFKEKIKDNTSFTLNEIKAISRDVNSITSVKRPVFCRRDLKRSVPITTSSLKVQVTHNPLQMVRAAISTNFNSCFSLRSGFHASSVLEYLRFPHVKVITVESEDANLEDILSRAWVFCGYVTELEEGSFKIKKAAYLFPVYGLRGIYANSILTSFKKWCKENGLIALDNGGWADSMGIRHLFTTPPFTMTKRAVTNFYVDYGDVIQCSKGKYQVVITGRKVK